MTDRRDGRYTQHELSALIRKRPLQIVAGYEDCSDADTLRRDPLLIFDSQMADLVAAVLRPGIRGAACSVVPILRRVIRQTRKVLGRRVRILVRADSGVVTPAPYKLREQQGLEHEIGFARNPRLQRRVEDFAAQAQRQFDQERNPMWISLSVTGPTTANT